MKKPEQKMLNALKPRKEPIQGRSKLKIERILKATQDVMRKKGVRAVTTHAIAAAAGVNIASIYQYFPNKEAIIQALYEQKLVNIRTKLSEISETLDPANWKDEVYRFVFAVKRFEEQIGFDRTIIEATQYYELLEGTWRAHADQIARTTSQLMRRMGSKWSDRALHDLALYIYSLSAATWNYWRLRGAEPDVGLHRQAIATVALFGLAIESDTEIRPSEIRTAATRKRGPARPRMAAV